MEFNTESLRVTTPNPLLGGRITMVKEFKGTFLKNP